MDKSEDLLGRWPLARRVYSTAVSGPDDWSVRVGVYGEWGCGKTTILEFVEKMARDEGHEVIWFKPWGYESATLMWRSLLAQLGTLLREKALAEEGAHDPETNDKLSIVNDYLADCDARLTGRSPKGLTTGREAMRESFEWLRPALEKLRTKECRKRILILVDDLERAADNLVPEILYALKEVLDLPGFSFVCAFDPDEVNRILCRRDSSTTNGQRYLDKIINFPIWVSPPSRQGLSRLAKKDLATYCNFIPAEPIDQVLDLLPRNPRSVRQFVRYLTQLKDEALRYDPEELNWPVILLSNLIKATLPQLDSEQLHDRELYGEIGFSQVWDKPEEMNDKLLAHFEKCAKQDGLLDPRTGAREIVVEAMRRMSKHLNFWLDAEHSSLVTQATLFEFPVVMTGKEYAELFALYCANARQGMEKALQRLSSERDRPLEHLCFGVLDIAVSRMKANFSRGAGAFWPQEGELAQNEARQHLRLIQYVLFPDQDSALQILSFSEWCPLAPLIRELTRFGDSYELDFPGDWADVQKLIRRIVDTWPGALDVLINAVRDVGHRGREQPTSKAGKKFAKEICQMIEPKVWNYFLEGYREPQFLVNHLEVVPWKSEFQQILAKCEHAFWKAHKASFYKLLDEATGAPHIRENAYAHLLWFGDNLESWRAIESDKQKTYPVDHECMQKLLDTVTFTKLADYPIRRLGLAIAQLRDHGVNLRMPDWWPQQPPNDLEQSTTPTPPRSEPEEVDDGMDERK